VPSPGVPAPTGRKISAQGKAPRAAALGHAPKNTPSPEGAKQSAAQPRIVAEVARCLSAVEELEPVVSGQADGGSVGAAHPPIPPPFSKNPHSRISPFPAQSPKPKA